MDIALPKIVRVIRLSDYAPEFGEAAIHVWLNPPRSFLRKLEELRSGLAAEPSEATMTEWYGWIAEVWSQGPEGTRWTVDEVKLMAERCADTDPGLMNHLVTTTLEMIFEHRRAAQKN